MILKINLLLIIATIFSSLSLYANPKDCQTLLTQLISGKNYTSSDDLNEHIGALSNARTLIFDDQNKPYEKLFALAPLFERKDPALSKIGTFKKVKEQKWDTRRGNYTAQVDAFEFKSGKNTLLIKLPIEGDWLNISMNPMLSTASFRMRETQLIQRKKWNGKDLLLIGPSDKLAFMAAEEVNPPDPVTTLQLEQIADFTSKIKGDVSQLLLHPQYISNKGLNLFGSPTSDDELKIITDLLEAAGENTQKMSDDLALMTLAKEQDYRRMSLQFVLAHKLPSAKDFEALATIETKKSNGTIEFGDGDLQIRLLSEKPYKLWLKESEGLQYLIERKSVDSKETKISFGAPNNIKGAVKGNADSFQESGNIDTYPIGRLKFPLELIQIRLEE